MSEEYLIATYIEEDNVLVTEIYGYGLDIVMAALPDIQRYVNEEGKKAKSDDPIEYTVSKLNWHPPQIGAHPPPNVEIPGYYGMVIRERGVWTPLVDDIGG